QQATAAFGLAHYGEAARLYESAFQAHPDSGLLFNAAQAHRLAGTTARALELYRNYLRLFPKGSSAAQAKRHIAELERAAATPPPQPTPPPVPPLQPTPPPAPPPRQPPAPPPRRVSGAPHPAAPPPSAARVSPIAAGTSICLST